MLPRKLSVYSSRSLWNGLQWLLSSVSNAASSDSLIELWKITVPRKSNSQSFSIKTCTCFQLSLCPTIFPYRKMWPGNCKHFTLSSFVGQSFFLDCSCNTLSIRPRRLSRRRPSRNHSKLAALGAVLGWNNAPLCKVRGVSNAINSKQSAREQLPHCLNGDCVVTFRGRWGNMNLLRKNSILMGKLVENVIRNGFKRCSLK